MFCPVCKDEFRAGFTRCEDCDADLVSDLDDAAAVAAATVAATPDEPVQGSEEDLPPAFIEMSDYCGFLSLEEAREARDTLRTERIRSEIVIREAPGGDPAAPAVEEFWIRVEDGRIREANRLLQFDDDDDEVPDAGGSSQDPFRL